MHHTDRQQFLAVVAETVEEVYGAPPDGQSASGLRERLASRLGGYLSEPQPLVGTEATILIADIRGFTALLEFYSQARMAVLLNRFFALVSQVIWRHGGVIDKFMGDSVMALFGAPECRPDDPLRALACAVDIQLAMVDFNRQSDRNDEPRLYVGIAVSTGEVVAGSFGSELYREYSVIGDPVNLAARIEGYTLRGQILLSEASYLATQPHIEVGEVHEVMVKGKSEPVKLYDLKAVNHPYTLVVPEIEVRKSPRILVDFPVVFRKVEAKRIMSERFVGKVNDLGYFGLSADLPLILPTYSEILMSLTPEFGAESPVEVYARVLRATRNKGGYRTNLQFTTIDTPGHLKVKQYIDQILWGK